MELLSELIRDTDHVTFLSPWFQLCATILFTT